MPVLGANAGLSCASNGAAHGMAHLCMPVLGAAREPLAFGAGVAGEQQAHPHLSARTYPDAPGGYQVQYPGQTRSLPGQTRSWLHPSTSILRRCVVATTSGTCCLKGRGQGTASWVVHGLRLSGTV